MMCIRPLRGYACKMIESWYNPLVQSWIGETRRALCTHLAALLGDSKWIRNLSALLLEKSAPSDDDIS